MKLWYDDVFVKKEGGSNPAARGAGQAFSTMVQSISSITLGICSSIIKMMVDTRNEHSAAMTVLEGGIEVPSQYVSDLRNIVKFSYVPHGGASLLSSAVLLEKYEEVEELEAGRRDTRQRISPHYSNGLLLNSLTSGMRSNLLDTVAHWHSVGLEPMIDAATQQCEDYN